MARLAHGARRLKLYFYWRGYVVTAAAAGALAVLIPPELLQLTDFLKTWEPIALPVIMFGAKQAQAIAKRFEDHYRHDAPETREQALRNGADAARRLRDEVNERIERGELTVEQAKAAFRRPDISKHAQDALLVASETPDPLVHDELAKLIGARLIAPQDSRLSILLRMACDQLRYLNSQQLRLLGLTFAVLYAQPDHEDLEGASIAVFDAAYAEYLKDVEETVAPFCDLPPPHGVDFMHFEELGLAKLSSWSASMGLFTSKEVSQSALLGHLQQPFYAMSLDQQIPANSTVQWIKSLMDGDAARDAFGFKAAKLTPVGYTIGQCMYCIAHGEPFKPTA